MAEGQGQGQNVGADQELPGLSDLAAAHNALSRELAEAEQEEAHCQLVTSALLEQCGVKGHQNSRLFAEMRVKQAQNEMGTLWSTEAEERNKDFAAQLETRRVTFENRRNETLDLSSDMLLRQMEEVTKMKDPFRKYAHPDQIRKEITELEEETKNQTAESERLAKALEDLKGRVTDAREHAAAAQAVKDLGQELKCKVVALKDAVANGEFVPEIESKNVEKPTPVVKSHGSSNSNGILGRLGFNFSMMYGLGYRPMAMDAELMPPPSSPAPASSMEARNFPPANRTST